MQGMLNSFGGEQNKMKGGKGTHYHIRKGLKDKGLPAIIATSPKLSCILLAK